MPALEWMRETGEALLDFVYPPKCYLCGAVGDWLCEDCIALWPLPEPPICPSCGDPLPVDACLRCSAGLRPLTAAAFVAVFDEGVRECVHKLKYDGKRRLAGPMAEAMAFAVRTRPSMQGVEVLVPIALHPKRLRKRGYNQAEWLASALAERLNLPVENALTRVRDTHTQVGLRAAERRANMEGAFQATAACAGKNVLLIDDVSTTGATARDAARALKASGAASVRLLTFARDL